MGLFCTFRVSAEYRQNTDFTGSHGFLIILINISILPLCSPTGTGLAGGTEWGVGVVPAGVDRQRHHAAEAQGEV